MTKRIIMIVLLALLSIIACFAESISVQVKITRSTNNWSSWGAQLLTTLPANPANGIEYVVRVKISNSSKFTWAALRNAQKKYTDSSNTVTNPNTLEVYFGYRTRNGTSYRLSQLITVSLENTANKTYTFDFDYEPYSTYQPTKGNIWFESYHDVFDLEEDLAVPKYTTLPSSVSSSAECLGVIKTTGNSHRMEVTVESTGRFESLSDPAKYMDFSVALVPCYTATGSATELAYNYAISPSNIGTGTVKNSTDTVPFTARGSTSSVTVVTPKTEGTSCAVGSSNANVSSFAYYLMVCVDEPDAETLKHVSQKDDYYATITISWECAESSCSLSHTDHTQTIVLRAYYGDDYSANDNDWVNLVITPSAESANLNIRDICSSNTRTATIASLQLMTGSRTDTANNNAAYQWGNHLYVFISSSNEYDENGGSFKLLNNKGYEIPFTVEVYTNNSLNKQYDGTAYWGVSATRSDYCLNLGSLSTTTDGTHTYGFLNFNAEVRLTITAAGAAAVNAGVGSNENIPGRYGANIYYHLVYMD